MARHSERVQGYRERTGAYLAGLSSTEEQHLDLILSHHPVPLQLVLNLVIT